MRPRADGTDAPEYRIYKTGYRKEMFCDGDHFFTDAETEAMAKSLGIVGTHKLTTSEYRAVILRTESNTKERARIQRFGLEYSFGPRRLPNLDKLIATMVKNQVRFEELVQVAVGLIQDDLGRGAERNKVSIKQQRSAMDRWLRNRDAVVEARKLEPRILGLNGMCLNHRTAEEEFRELHADVATLTDKREAEKRELQGIVTAEFQARALVIQSREEERKVIVGRTVAASAKSVSAKTAYDEAAGNQTHYEKGEAALWATRVDAIPALQQRRNDISSQVQVAEAAAASARHEYTGRWLKVESDAAARVQELENSKEPHRQACETSVSEISDLERAARESCDAEVQAQREDLAASLEPLHARRGELNVLVANPQAPLDVLEAEREAVDRLTAHGIERTKAGRKYEVAADEARKAQKAYDDLEANQREVKRRVEAFSATLDAAKLRLAPKDGTLLSALRQHSDTDWKLNLARVINPALLERADLNPHFIPEALTDVVYGWALDQAAIAAPDWTDDERMRAAVNDAERVLATARTELADVDGKLKAAGVQRTLAEKAKELADAEALILDGKAKGLRDALELARLRVGSAKESAKQLAIGELSSVGDKIGEIGTQLKSLELAHGKRRGDIRTSHERMKVEAVSRRDIALKAIDQAIADVRHESSNRVQALKKQLDEHLSEKGVDVQNLQRLQKQVEELDREITGITGKVAFVEAWRKWMSEAGPNEVARLKQESESAASESQRQAAALSSFEAQSKRESEAFEAAQSRRQGALKNVIDDLEILSKLWGKFDGYGKKPHESFDTRIRAEDLKGKIERHRAWELMKSKQAGTAQEGMRGALEAWLWV
ncbi:ATP-binding protein [Paucibacter soli]|uniref:ATP-binding protein n=1 Tax=Paucibacter soli TaxID=3133433 RepID=UPI0030970910